MNPIERCRLEQRAAAEAQRPGDWGAFLAEIDWRIEAEMIWDEDATDDQ